MAPIKKQAEKEHRNFAGYMAFLLNRKPLAQNIITGYFVRLIKICTFTII